MTLGGEEGRTLPSLIDLALAAPAELSHRK
jgi:hypothetical protein